MAEGEYHTSTTVESLAGTPSTGVICEKPVRRAACAHMGSFITPSIVASATMRGGRACVAPRRPLYVAPEAAGVSADARESARASMCGEEGRPTRCDPKARRIAPPAVGFKGPRVWFVFWGAAPMLRPRCREARRDSLDPCDRRGKRGDLRAGRDGRRRRVPRPGARARALG